MAWFSHLLDAYDPGRLGRAVDVRTTALDHASRKAVPTMSAPTARVTSRATRRMSSCDGSLAERIPPTLSSTSVSRSRSRASALAWEFSRAS